MPDLLLRPWRPEDRSALAEAFRTTPDLVAQLGGAELSTEMKAAEFIEKSLGGTPSRRNWAIVVAGKAVGNLGLSAIEWQHETAWAYYWLADSARGNAYAATALLTAAEWAFKQGIHRLELGHRVNNPASCKVAARAGFLPEGIERQKLQYGGKRFDVELHARLSNDPYPPGPHSSFTAHLEEPEPLRGQAKEATP